MGRKENLFEYQSHALHHALGNCSGSVPRTKSGPTAVCPLCLNRFELGEMEEEHTPQRSGQSRLGNRWSLLLTCSACNHRAGESFESASATVRDTFAGNGHFCSVHPGFGHTATGLWVSLDPQTVNATDLKSAYLLACLTLGHRWFLSTRLDPVRRAIASGQGTGSAVVVSIGATGANMARAVCEVTEPASFVMVVGTLGLEGSLAVIFPSEGGPPPNTLFSPPSISPLGGRIFLPSLPGINGTTPVHISCRTFQWPRLFDATFKQVDAYDRSGSLFHLDRCGSHATGLTNHQMSERVAQLGL